MKHTAPLSLLSLLLLGTLTACKKSEPAPVVPMVTVPGPNGGESDQQAPLETIDLKRGSIAAQIQGRPAEIMCVIAAQRSGQPYDVIYRGKRRSFPLSRPTTISSKHYQELWDQAAKASAPKGVDPVLPAPMPTMKQDIVVHTNNSKTCNAYRIAAPEMTSEKDISGTLGAPFWKLTQEKD